MVESTITEEMVLTVKFLFLVLIDAVSILPTSTVSFKID
jgi:hypothetical protein